MPVPFRAHPRIPGGHGRGALVLAVFAVAAATHGSGGEVVEHGRWCWCLVCLWHGAELLVDVCELCCELCMLQLELRAGPIGVVWER